MFANYVHMSQRISSRQAFVTKVIGPYSVSCLCGVHPNRHHTTNLIPVSLWSVSCNF